MICNVRYFIQIYALSTGSLIGTVVGTALSGVLIQYTAGGWPSVFYVFGALGVLWFIVWVLIFYNDPQSHPFISDEEKMFLQKSIGGLNDKEVSLMMTYHV